MKIFFALILTLFFLLGCTNTQQNNGIQEELPNNFEPDSQFTNEEENQMQENQVDPPDQINNQNNETTETQNQQNPPAQYGQQDYVEDNQTVQDSMPVLYNLGLNFGAWNKETNKAGDFVFVKGLFDNKIFVESAAYVVGSNGPKLIPEITFHVPNGTQVFSPVNGKIFRVEKIYSNDYTVHIQTSENSQWLVSFEHLENLKVQEGQIVKVGEIIGDASTFGGLENFAFTELVVWKGGATEEDIVKVCPVTLLAQEVRMDFEEKIRQLAKDWEEFSKEDIYDEDSWFAPGCFRESLTEFEAMNPNNVQ